MMKNRVDYGKALGAGKEKDVAYGSLSISLSVGYHMIFRDIFFIFLYQERNLSREGEHSVAGSVIINLSGR